MRDRDDYVPGIIQKTARFRDELGQQEKQLVAGLL